MKGRTGSIVACMLAVCFLVACSSSKKSSSSSSSAAAATTTTTSGFTQTMTITPNTGLTDGEVVTIVGKGYKAGQQYGITECADKGAATMAGDCNLRGIKVATADSTGTVTAQYPVAKGPFGSNNIVCGAAQKCLVSVANAGAASPTEEATEDLGF